MSRGQEGVRILRTVFQSVSPASPKSEPFLSDNASETKTDRFLALRPSASLRPLRLCGVSAASLRYDPQWRVLNAEDPRRKRDGGA